MIRAYPTVFEVDRVRDGGTFATRLVKAIQHGEAILDTSVSFQVDVEGLEHQIAMPAEPSEPGGILYEDEMRSGVAALGFEQPVEEVASMMRRAIAPRRSRGRPAASARTCSPARRSG